MTDSPHELTLSKLSNTRDLRAGMLSLAAKLLIQGDSEGRLVVVNPVISSATVRKEWEESLPAIASGVRERMTPGGHLKFPHLWPGQNPPPDSDGTRCVYAL